MTERGGKRKRQKTGERKKKKGTEKGNWCLGVSERTAKKFCGIKKILGGEICPGGWPAEGGATIRAAGKYRSRGPRLMGVAELMFLS